MSAMHWEKEEEDASSSAMTTASGSIKGAAMFTVNENILALVRLSCLLAE